MISNPFYPLNKKQLLVLFVMSSCIIGDVASVFAQKASGTIPVNDIKYYYEIHGEGEPLLMLHGGLGSFDMFNPILSQIIEKRQVIGIDLRGHGRTELGDKPLNYMELGDDVAYLLSELGYTDVDVLGYSMGGFVALRLAAQYPDIVRKLIIVSAVYSHPEGWFPEIVTQQRMLGAEMASSMKETPMYQSYAKLAPNPKDFPTLLDRMGELMRAPFNWSDDVCELKMPVLLIYGDSDMVKPEHIIQFYQHLGGGLKDAGWTRENMVHNRLAILPGLTHYDIFLAPEMVSTAMQFLD